MNRRKFLLSATALVGAGVLAACAVTSQNGTTTVTVNVAAVSAYLSGAASLEAALVAFPGVAAAIGPTAVTFANAITAKIVAAASAVSAAANGNQTFSFTTTSPPAFITSLEQDGATLMSDLNTAITAAGGSFPSAAQEYFDGLVAVLNAISALFQIGAAVASATVNKTMSASQALALVGMKAP